LPSWKEKGGELFNKLIKRKRNKKRKKMRIKKERNREFAFPFHAFS